MDPFNWTLMYKIEDNWGTIPIVKAWSKWRTFHRAKLTSEKGIGNRIRRRNTNAVNALVWNDSSCFHRYRSRIYSVAFLIGITITINASHLCENVLPSFIFSFASGFHTLAATSIYSVSFLKMVLVFLFKHSLETSII